MTIQHRGTITTWKDDKGYGFITPDDGGSPVFFHISGLMQRHPRPAEQVVVVYTLKHDEQQRARATNIHFVTKEVRLEPLITVVVVCLFFLILYLGTWITPLTPWILVLYGIISIITYGLYALDKERSQQSARRISEATLHFLELAGGWPGALLAQEYHRHKTVKVSYQRTFWFMVGGNLVLLIGYSVFLLFTQR